MQIMATPTKMTQSVKVQRKEGYGCVKLKSLDPNQVLVSHNCPGIALQDSPFFEHWEYKTVSQLRQEGFDVEDGISDNSEQDDDDARGSSSDKWWLKDDEEYDPSTRRLKVRECWIRYDENDDGKADLIHAIVVGSTIIHQEEVDVIPVASMTPQIMPHRHTGMGVAEAVEDLQQIKTQLMRGLMDNLYLSVHGRFAINANTVRQLAYTLMGLLRLVGVQR